MRIIGSLLLVSVVVTLSCGGLALAQDNKTNGDVIVVKAKHFRTTGPCIEMGKTLVMPIIDAFSLTEVVNGSLPESVEVILVRALSGQVKAVKEGEIYLVELAPSADTKSQIKDRAKDGYSWLWVNESELKVQQKKRN